MKCNALDAVLDVLPVSPASSLVDIDGQDLVRQVSCIVLFFWCIGLIFCFLAVS